MQLTIHDMSGPPTNISSIFGNSMSQQFIDSINLRNTGSVANFDTMHDASKQFFTRIYKPSMMAVKELRDSYGDVLKLDIFRPLVTVDDFMYVPPVMRDCIMMYPPVRELYAQGRIYGWDMNLEEIPEDDYYGRMSSNFHMENIGGNETGYVDYEFTVKSTDTYDDEEEDPEVIERKCDAIRETRKKLDELLRLNIDPTYPDSVIG